ncbi:unnamed protein product [Protopolystoma xenopodis]|uniref:Uncharacterized protein n=1 Tax=Protopolystoma xenopodis TaxID=117903 RepID=A0A3S5CE25_9PLAT|nr:unnamed protein product [Protopolystoma xenopodis]
MATSIHPTCLGHSSFVVTLYLLTGTEELRGASEELHTVYSRIILRVSWYHDSDVLECRAEANSSVYAGVGGTQHRGSSDQGQPETESGPRAKVQLSVQFPPNFARIGFQLNWPEVNWENVTSLANSPLPHYIITEGKFTQYFEIYKPERFPVY